MGKLSISMTIFNSYVSLPEGKWIYLGKNAGDTTNDKTWITKPIWDSFGM